MDSLTDTRPSVVLRSLTLRRPRWLDGPDEAKVRIVEESLSGPRLASGRLGVPSGFVPAMIVAEPPEKGTGSGCGRIEIVSANGRRVLVDNESRRWQGLPDKQRGRTRFARLCAGAEILAVRRLRSRSRPRRGHGHADRDGQAQRHRSPRLGSPTCWPACRITVSVVLKPRL